MKHIFFFLFFHVTCEIPKVKIIGGEKINNKYILDVIKTKLNSQVAYNYLVKKNNDDPLETLEYMEKNTPNMRVIEWGIIYTMLKLSEDPENLYIISDLQKKLEENFRDSKYLWLGNFISGVHHLTKIDNIPQNNSLHIINMIESIGLCGENNKKYTQILFFIGSYYLIEYYLYLAIECRKLENFNEVIIYCTKIISRFQIHPIAAIESLLLLIEVLIILKADILVNYYISIFLENIKNNNQLNHYKKRLENLLILYNI